MKGLTPSPELVLPAAGYSLSSEGPEAVEGWKVQRDDDRRTLLSQKVSFDEKTFSADFVLSLLQSDPISPNLQSSEPDVGTPKQGGQFCQVPDLHLQTRDISVRC